MKPPRGRQEGLWGAVRAAAAPGASGKCWGLSRVPERGRLQAPLAPGLPGGAAWPQISHPRAELLPWVNLAPRSCPTTRLQADMHSQPRGECCLAPGGARGCPAQAQVSPGSGIGAPESWLLQGCSLLVGYSGGLETGMGSDHPEPLPTDRPAGLS